MRLWSILQEKKTQQRDVPRVTDEALFRLALLSLDPKREKPGSGRGIQLLKWLKRDFPRSSWSIHAEPLLELVDVAEDLKTQNRNLSTRRSRLRLRTGNLPTS